MSEFTPPWQWARMTKSQIKKYAKELEKKRAIAQKKLDEAKARWDFDEEKKELKDLEKALENI